MKAKTKRTFDVCVALIALTVLSPVLLVVALLVRTRLGSPVLFRQRRPGLHGVPFELIKFRTMTNATDSTGRLESDAERLTAFGSFLRSTSLDELPCLLNVVRGGKTPDIVLDDAQAMGYRIAILPGLLLGGIISVCDELLEDVKRLGKYPPAKGDSSPARTFARFGAADWDERRTAFRDPLTDPLTDPARATVPAK